MGICRYPRDLFVSMHLELHALTLRGEVSALHARDPKLSPYARASQTRGIHAVFA